MKQYLELLKDIKNNGIIKKDRTGTGTISIFGRQLRFNLNEGFPLLTTKKMAWEPMVTELLWFLKGRTDLRYLVEKKCKIWVGDAYKRYSQTNNDLSRTEFIEKIKTDDIFSEKWGDFGPIYGKQWRDWNGIDQIKNLIDDLKNNPDSRRLMVNAWNVFDIPDMLLPPCHYGFQCYTKELTFDERFLYTLKTHKEIHLEKGDINLIMDNLNIPKRSLSLMWNQRSCDAPLGIPFNISSYALLTLLICEQVNMLPNELIGNLGDTHIYSNQMEGVEEQLKREPLKLPRVEIKKKELNDISDYELDDIKLIDYESYDRIHYPLEKP